MKKYIASYQNGKDECWDMVILAENLRDDRKEARRAQKEMGRLWSVRRIYDE